MLHQVEVLEFVFYGFSNVKGVITNKLIAKVYTRDLFGGIKARLGLTTGTLALVALLPCIKDV
jgi:hypothetical protein